MRKNINKSKRMMVGIPEGTEIHTFLKNNGKISQWELLNNLVITIPKSKEDRAVKHFDDFVTAMSELYPEKKESFEKLKPLVIRQIVRKNTGIDGEYNPLSESYFEELKKL